MNLISRTSLTLSLSLWFSLSLIAAPRDLFTVEFPAGSGSSELRVPARFHLYIPSGTKTVRAILVRQHGCGTGAEESGENGAYDLQWRALAQKHGAALLSPHYQAGDAECRQWCDPRNGSGATFVRALSQLATLSAHPEITTAPWCLWGHSGGAFWSTLMLETHPERIIAIWCRSGSAVMAWEKDEIPAPNYPEAAWDVPIAFNPGLRERGDARFDGAWQTSWRSLQLFRSHGAPVLFAPDPLSSHDCRNSRLLAIPYFDFWLRSRLASRGSVLNATSGRRGVLVDWTTGQEPTTSQSAKSENLSWLPDVSLLRAYREYMTKGLVEDLSAPGSIPCSLRVTRVEGLNEWILEWEAEADLESGIRQFVIYRDGQEVARLPESPDEKTGFGQFQGISFHDTPIPGYPHLRWVDYNQPRGRNPRYQVSFINGAGKESVKSRSVQGR